MKNLFKKIGYLFLLSTFLATPSAAEIHRGAYNGSSVTPYSSVTSVPATSLLGNPTGSTANASAITLGAGLSFSGTTLTNSGGALTNTHIFVGNASNVPVDVALSGDSTIANTGAITNLQAAKWTTARTLAGNSVDGSGNVAFSNKFIVQGTADSGLSAAQFMGALGTGIVKNTTTTGVLSIAIAGDFPTLNQNTSGTAGSLSGALSANQLLGSLTAVAPTGQTVPSCSTSSSALQWTSGTGFACNTAIAASTVTTNANLTGDTTSSGNATTTVKVNGVSYGTSPSTNTVPVVTGSNTVTYEAVPNTALANSSMTLAGYSVALGGTQTFACSDLSNGATGCSTATGTSGAHLPLLNAANTWSGVQTINNSDWALLGSSTGATTFTSDNAGASNFTMHVPAANDTLVDLAGTQALTNKSIAGSEINSSTVGLTYGGTAANLTASNGGIFYSTGSAGAILSGTATANQVLLSGASTTPAWSTATYPSTTTANQILFSSSNNVIAAIGTANSGVLVTSGAGVPSISSTLPVVTVPSGSTATDNIDANYTVSTSQLDKTSNTTLATVPGLSVTLTAGKTYMCTGHLTGTSGAIGGYKVAPIATNSLTATSSSFTIEGSNGVTFNQKATQAIGNAAGANAIFTDIDIQGAIVVNAGGTLNIQFAQNTSDGTVSSVYINSYFWCKRVN